MARPKKLFDATVARFQAGTFDRIAAALGEGQDRASFIREAVEEKLARDADRRRAAKATKDQ